MSERDINQPVTMSRTELYELVWTTPMRKLAASFGMSDRGLAKCCKKHKIPCTPRGYWTKLKWGDEPTRKPLPPLDDPCLGTVVIHRQQRAPFVYKEVEEIPVPETLEASHPLVARTLKSISAAKPRHTGIVRPGAKGCLSVAVGPRSIGRAMRIWDALIKALEAKGFPVSVGENGSGNEATIVRVLGEALEVQLSEALDRKPKEYSKKALKKREQWSWRNEIEYDYFPSGRLQLRIERALGQGFRQVWSDGNQVRIENGLGMFIAGLVRAAEATRMARQKEEEQKREWTERKRGQAREEAEEAKKRGQREEQKLREQHRRDEMQQMLTNWEKCKKIRSLLGELTELLPANKIKVPPGSELENQMLWMEEEATRLDPLRNVRVSQPP